MSQFAPSKHWLVDVEEYNRQAQDSVSYYETFETKEQALDYIKILADYNCNVSLREIFMDGEGSYDLGSPVWYNHIVYL